MIVNKNNGNHIINQVDFTVISLFYDMVDSINETV
jgi:hypothetical protein